MHFEGSTSKITEAELEKGAIIYDLTKIDEEGIPQDFICPISQEIIKDPVIFIDTTQNSKTIYDISSAKALAIKLKQQKDKRDPMGLGDINSPEFIRIPAAKQVIEKWALADNKMDLITVEPVKESNIEENKVVPFKPGIGDNLLLTYLLTADMNIDAEQVAEQVRQYCLQGYDPFVEYNKDSSPFYFVFHQGRFDLLNIMINNAHPQAFADSTIAGEILQSLILSNHFGHAKLFASQMLQHNYQIASLQINRDLIMKHKNLAGDTFAMFLLNKALLGQSTWDLFEQSLDLMDMSQRNQYKRTIICQLSEAEFAGEITLDKVSDLFEKITNSSAVNTISGPDRAYMFFQFKYAKKYKAMESVLISDDTIFMEKPSQSRLLFDIMEEAIAAKNSKQPFDFGRIVRQLCVMGFPVVFPGESKDNPIQMAIDNKLESCVVAMLQSGGDKLTNKLMNDAISVVSATDIKTLFNIIQYTNSPKTNDALAAKFLFKMLQQCDMDQTLKLVDNINQQKSDYKNKLTSNGWSTLYKIAKNHLLELKLNNKANIEDNEQAKAFINQRRTFKALTFFKTTSAKILEEAKNDPDLKYERAKKHLAREEAETETKMILRR